MYYEPTNKGRGGEEGEGGEGKGEEAGRAERMGESGKMEGRRGEDQRWNVLDGIRQGEGKGKEGKSKGRIIRNFAAHEYMTDKAFGGVLGLVLRPW